MQSKTIFHFLVAFSHIHSKSKYKLNKLIKTLQIGTIFIEMFVSQKLYNFHFI